MNVFFHECFIFCFFKSSIYGLDPDPNGFKSSTMPTRPDMMLNEIVLLVFIRLIPVLYCISIMFQFSDMLLYANRTTTPGLQFRVHGQLAVPDLQV